MKRHALAAWLLLLPLTTMAQDAPTWFRPDGGWILVGVLAVGALVAAGILQGRAGRAIETRPIAGLVAAEDAIGRAVEMGRPVVFVTGTQSITKPGTVAGLSVLRLVAEKCAETGARLIVPCIDTIVTRIAIETVEEAYRQAGRHDQFVPDDVFFVSNRQLAYTAAVNGVIEREHPATVFLQGEFSAESLIFGETGSRAGAMMIAGTDKETQLPFFVTTCDHTLIGEELYGAGAAISEDAQLLGSLRGVDLGRVAVLALVAVGIVLELARVEWLRTVLGG
ncbi:hypothetical protein HN371_07440 [Candidatus Poribacteria bacterium]|nr:hypothetical protein [Candidatus Poribacteria bacterium]MBT7100850.1 hypothetical protein [Candidatus Poribacteria bacterium]MBT7805802.1 hypothetical protein [Candidatus Poribacteria bacterium]